MSLLLRPALGARCIAPIRQQIHRPVVKRAVRAVTTDAASSHAEKEHVPRVGRATNPREHAIDSRKGR